METIQMFRRVGLVAIAAAVGAAAPARAQESSRDSPPVAPTPTALPAPPLYQTPLYQRTQPSYVPQSVALFGPRIIADWEEGDPIPPGYRRGTRMQRGLVIAGSVVFGTLYALSALVAADAADSRTPGASMWVPAVGPFLQMPNSTSTVSTFALALDGLGQTAGAVMLLIGLTSPKTVLVRNDLGLDLRPGPIAVGRHGAGWGLTGTF